jgi:IclR family acetate operon transcriptional repressor
MAPRESMVTLKRGVSILEALAGASPSRGLDHAALARRLNFTRSTLYRYLAALEERGLVEQAAPGRYRLGPTIVYLAAVVHSRDFTDLAREYVQELAGGTGETAYATVYDYPYSVAVLVEEGSGPVGPRVPIGSRMPLHCSASGKVYLAHELPRVIDSYLQGTLEARTPNTMTDPGQIKRALGEVLASGYAVDQGENHASICGLSSPVFDFAGNVVGALSIVLATTRLRPKQIRELAEPLTVATQSLSERIGYSERGEPRRRFVGST